MSKSQLYQSFEKGNSNDLLEFLSTKGVWNSPELELSIIVKLSVKGKLIEFPLYRNLSKQQITEILEKFGYNYSDFEEYLKSNL